MRVEFRFCPSCGARLEPRQVEGHLLPACPSCEFVGWRDPKVAAALVASDQQGRVLLIRRGIDPGRGGWALPGGYVDDLEDPAESAVRECREETHLEAEVDSLLGVFPVRSEEGGLLVLAYAGRLVGGSASPTDEAPEVRCFPVEEIPEVAFASHREALAAWGAGRAEGV